jgi:hypothetical protein
MVLSVEHVPPDKLETDIILQVRFTLTFTDPNVVVEYEANFDNGLVFECEGRYLLRLMANGVQIMQRNFQVFRSGT